MLPDMIGMSFDIRVLLNTHERVVIVLPHIRSSTQRSTLSTTHILDLAPKPLTAMLHLHL